MAVVANLGLVIRAVTDIFDFLWVGLEGFHPLRWFGLDWLNSFRLDRDLGVEPPGGEEEDGEEEENSEDYEDIDDDAEDDAGDEDNEETRPDDIPLD